MSEKTPAPAKTFDSYVKNKCIIGYGIINGIINAIIFACIEWGKFSTDTFGWSGVLFQMALNGFLLGAILFPIVVPLTKMDKNKGSYQMPATEPALSRYVPKSYVAAILLVSVISLIVAIVAAIVFAWIFSLFAGMPLSCMLMFWIKLLTCAVTGGCAGYFTILYVSR